MKTNVNLPRVIDGYEFHQRTKDSFFDANELLLMWNKSHATKKRQMLEFINLKQTAEFLTALQSELAQSGKVDMVQIKPLQIIKGRNTSKGKTPDQVWMHPYLFTKFAMWINPVFEVKVIKYVHDQLIVNRHAAGDNYGLLTRSGVKLPGYNFAEIATCMQWIVFGIKGKNQRQTATQEQLQELADTERTLSFMIDMGVIKTYDQLMVTMRTMWENKYQKKIA